MNEQTTNYPARHLHQDDVQINLQAASLSDLSLVALVTLFQEEIIVRKHAPDGIYQQDPRDEALILYSEARLQRPHDNKPEETAVSQASSPKPCPICAGKTTGIVDVASLQQGVTFINKNLYPAVYPAAQPDRFSGLHFLQWTSSYHDHDWHNLPQADCVVVLSRLAALEQKLVRAESPLFGAEVWPDGSPYRGYAGIFKNLGYLVGGSLAHGHQQIVYSPVLPPGLALDWTFFQRHGKSVAAYIRRENPPDLLLRDYGGMLLLVPYFMKRPYHMLLLPKADRTLLSDLTADEIAAMAAGWHDAIRAMRTLLPEIGREIAFNVVVHNGPGAGLYVEFLPYSQEIGGMEHLGLWICQGTRETAAADLRRVLENDDRRLSMQDGG